MKIHYFQRYHEKENVALELMIRLDFTRIKVYEPLVK